MAQATPTRQCQPAGLLSIPFEDAEEIRVERGPDGEPWVIASDVCRIAGHTNSRAALARLDESEKGFVTIQRPTNGPQRVQAVNESGFNALLLSFRLRPGHPHFDRLMRFRRWVTGEVLPSIRRTGSYVAGRKPEPAPPPTNAGSDLAALADIVAELARRQSGQDARIAAVESRLAMVEGPAPGHYGLREWAEANGVKLCASAFGLEAARIYRDCRMRGIPTSRVEGMTGKSICHAYPESILVEWLADYRRRAKTLPANYGASHINAIRRAMLATG